MADEVRSINEQQQHLKNLLDKFNSNPDDQTITEAEKLLLLQFRSVQQEIFGLSRQIDELNKEIRERQDKGNELVQQLISKQGESQGYVNILFKLK